MTLSKSSIGTQVHGKPGFAIATITDTGLFQYWRIDCPGGEALLVRCAGGTTPTEAAGRIAQLVGAANELLAGEKVEAKS